MTADELIDSYVANVVTLLPRKQRRDVAQELRMLLAQGQAPQRAGRHRASRPPARCWLASAARLR